MLCYSYDSLGLSTTLCMNMLLFRITLQLYSLATDSSKPVAIHGRHVDPDWTVIRMRNYTLACHVAL